MIFHINKIFETHKVGTKISGGVVDCFKNIIGSFHGVTIDGRSI